MKDLTFKRELRLLTPESFKNVFKKNYRVSSPNFIILSRKNNLNYPRLGITVAKKQMKRAVDRNRFKRVARESFRLNQHQLNHKDYVVIAKFPAKNKKNRELFESFDKLWKKLNQH